MGERCGQKVLDGPKEVDGDVLPDLFQLKRISNINIQKFKFSINYKLDGR